MERRWSRDSNPSTGEAKVSNGLQKKIVDGRRPTLQANQRQAPDLTDFMNDMFFGTAKTERKSYNLTGGFADDYDDFESSTRSNSSRSTQEWLEEARRLVASSPPHGCDSPGRRVGSPRFVATVQGRLSTSALDRRDPLSRSARRHRRVDSLSEEILNKSTAKHARNLSYTTLFTVTPPESPTGSPPPGIFPQRQSTQRRSRFRVPDQTDATAVAPPPRLLSPPKDATTLQWSASSTLSAAASFADDERGGGGAGAGAGGGGLLSPPRRIVESIQRRMVSSSTCSVDGDGVGGGLRIISQSTHSDDFSVNSGVKEEKEKEGGVNAFLKENRRKAEEVLTGERNARVNVVLSGPSNSTSSMVAAICFAWLLENRLNKKKGENNALGPIVVPVMNVKRATMGKLRQVAWLFYHVGLDATSLLFADEVDLESLMMDGKLSIHVIGQDILKSNGEVKSQCTVLTDNYCEEAYDLLQNNVLKNLLLAGILLDTQNLNTVSKLSTMRDAEAVQLLLVGTAPNYRNTLFDQLIKDHHDNNFVEALQLNYGKISDDGKFDSRESRISSKRSGSGFRGEPIKKDSDMKSQDTKNAKANRISPKSHDTKDAKANRISPNSDKPNAPQEPDAGRGKGRFFLARWFGFGSK